jgi:hypothetical protein
MCSITKLFSIIFLFRPFWPLPEAPHPACLAYGWSPSSRESDRKMFSMDFCNLNSQCFLPLMAFNCSTISQATENLPSAPTFFQNSRSNDQFTSLARMSLAMRTGVRVLLGIPSAFLVPQRRGSEKISESERRTSVRASMSSWLMLCLL